MFWKALIRGASIFLVPVICSKMKPRVFVVLVWILLATLAMAEAFGAAVNHVIHISVDGLRPDAILALGASNLPNFHRLRTQGAFTDNARTDYHWTVTLPNHASQLTGYPVAGMRGHNWIYNDDTAEEQTLASNRGAYVPGVFEVVHDRGLRTGLFASKTKFAIFSRSWNATNGAPDTIGLDHGRNKIDVSSLTFNDPASVLNALIANMTTQAFSYAFFHFATTDFNGHGHGWDVTFGTPYSDAVKVMDNHLGALFAMIAGSTQLSNQTALILTSDHGGTGYDHSDPLLPADYTIPFYVWGPTVTPGADLYAINSNSRKDPGGERPDFNEARQPIRNGDAANLALMLLGLPAVAGSSINSSQDLAVTAPFLEDFRIALLGNHEVFTFSTKADFFYDIESTTNLAGGTWRLVAGSIPGNGDRITNWLLRPVGVRQEFFRLRCHP